MKETSFVAAMEEKGISLRKWACSHFESLSLADIASLFDGGSIKVDGEAGDPAHLLKGGEKISVTLSDTLAEKAIEEGSPSLVDFSSLIIYEDDNILIANKPKDLLTQRNESFGPSLESYAREYVRKKDPSATVSSANRLDRGTSGVVLFGKNKEALSALGNALAGHEGIRKTYWALVNGYTDDSGTIETPLAKDKTTGLVAPRLPEQGGKPCKTSFKVLKRFELFTLEEVVLETGRTHQIRAHFLSIGHPLAGDDKYGDKAINETLLKDYGLKGQFLHAASIAFLSLSEPLAYLNGKTFSAPLPKNEEEMLKNLK